MVAVLGGAANSLSYINPYDGKISMSSMILQLTGSREDLVLGATVVQLWGFSMRMLPVFIISSVIGIRLYRHFCTASVYVFSRYPRRFRWCMSEAFGMLAASMMFECSYLFSAIVTAVLSFEVVFDKAGFILTAYYVIIYTVWLYCAAMLMGLAATYMGSDAAYIVTIGSQLFMIAMFGLTETERGRKTVMLNPMSHLVFGWQSSEVGVVSAAVGDHVSGNSYGISFGMTYLLFAAAAVAVTYTVGKNIERRDLFYFEAEA
jgi:hypothetical protein